ncbi:16S rRNA (cytosine(1402)-N(4))-methyltransferase RsmH [bacterium]|nr:16S rRNA (cytosine(1402)-N(4))-methyltransferase RsmH [bacterium]
MHTPVLLAEVLELLHPEPGERVIDATVGCGGHSAALIARILPGGRLLGIDRDAEALALARERLAPFLHAVELVQANFADLPRVVADTGFGPADCVLFDLGVSSLQLDQAARGFGFGEDGPLDMRMDPSGGPTASGVLRRSSEGELERMLRDYGDERFARRIARAIVHERGRLRTTGDLARLVERVVPRRERRIHPATRTFQALRVVVNAEYEALEHALASLPQWLAPGGRVAAISFHSGEDRRVKHTFRAYRQDGVLDVLTRKPVRPAEAEVEANPRARSSRLRAGRRCTAQTSGDDV